MTIFDCKSSSRCCFGCCCSVFSGIASSKKMSQQSFPRRWVFYCLRSEYSLLTGSHSCSSSAAATFSAAVFPLAILWTRNITGIWWFVFPCTSFCPHTWNLLCTICLWSFAGSSSCSLQTVIAVSSQLLTVNHYRIIPCPYRSRPGLIVCGLTLSWTCLVFVCRWPGICWDSHFLFSFVVARALCTVCRNFNRSIHRPSTSPHSYLDWPLFASIWRRIHFWF